MDNDEAAEIRIHDLRREAQKHLVLAAMHKKAAEAATRESARESRRYDELHVEANDLARQLAGLPARERPSPRAW